MKITNVFGIEAMKAEVDIKNSPYGQASSNPSSIPSTSMIDPD